MHRYPEGGINMLCCPEVLFVRIAPKMPSSEPIRVGIVEDDRLTREGLGVLIGGSHGYRCVGSFASLEQALASSNHERVGLISIYPACLAAKEWLSSANAFRPHKS